MSLSSAFTPSTSKYVLVRSKSTTSHVEPKRPAQRSRRKKNSASLNERSGRLSARGFFHSSEGHMTRSRQQ